MTSAIAPPGCANGSGKGTTTEPLTRGEGRELAVIVEETLALISPERWDRVMEMIVDEATRRTRAPSLFD